MSDLQIDVLAALFYITFPVYQLLTEAPHSKKDDIFYAHLQKHSSWFPRYRIVFPIVWTLMWSANGVGAYLFWHAYEPGQDTTYLVGLIFYAVSFVAQCGWYNLFFRRRLLKLSFFVSLVFIWGGSVGYFVCTVLYPQLTASIISGIVVGMLSVATLFTGVAAFWVPDHGHHHGHGGGSVVDQAEALLTNEESSQTPYARYGYDASGAQAVAAPVQGQARAPTAVAPVQGQFTAAGARKTPLKLPL
jgi:tryptophan-rich sensory protein